MAWLAALGGASGAGAGAGAAGAGTAGAAGAGAAGATSGLGASMAVPTALSSGAGISSAGVASALPAGGGGFMSGLGAGAGNFFGNNGMLGGMTGRSGFDPSQGFSSGNMGSLMGQLMQQHLQASGSPVPGVLDAATGGLSPEMRAMRYQRQAPPINPPMSSKERGR